MSDPNMPLNPSLPQNTNPIATLNALSNEGISSVSTNNPNESSYLVASQNSSKKKLWIAFWIALCISLLLLITVILNYFGFLPWMGKSLKAPTTLTPQVKKEIDIKEVAKETLDYIQTQHRSDGYYNFLAHFDELCTDSTKCPFGQTNVFPINNSWVSLANYAGYKIFNDQKYLDLSKQDMYQFVSYCETDMQKCLWGLMQPAIIYEDTKDPKIGDFLKKGGESLLVNSEAERSVMLGSMEVVTLDYLSHITGEQKYLDESLNRLQKIKDLIAQLVLKGDHDNPSYSQHQCWHTLAAIETSILTKDKSYADSVKTILEKNNLLKHFRESYLSVYILPCFDSLYKLASFTGEHSYSDLANELYSNYLTDFWDSKNSKLIWGEGGFAMFSDRVLSGKEQGKAVHMTDTSYNVYILQLINNYKPKI